MSATYLAISLMLLLGAGYFFGGNIPKIYRYRKCMGRSWKRAFPNSSAQDIRQFLTIFSQSFCFRAEHKLKFEPTDKPYEIYRLIYPSKLIPDAMELESFSQALQSHYKFRLESVWSENLSLGEIYAAIKNS